VFTVLLWGDRPPKVCQKCVPPGGRWGDRGGTEGGQTPCNHLIRAFCLFLALIFKGGGQRGTEGQRIFVKGIISGEWTKIFCLTQEFIKTLRLPGSIGEIDVDSGLRRDDRTPGHGPGLALSGLLQNAWLLSTASLRLSGREAGRSQCPPPFTLTLRSEKARGIVLRESREQLTEGR
jgi:hypothetical protein